MPLHELAQIFETNTQNVVPVLREERLTMLCLVRCLFNKGNDEACSGKSGMIGSFFFGCESVHLMSLFF